MKTLARFRKNILCAWLQPIVDGGNFSFTQKGLKQVPHLRENFRFRGTQHEVAVRTDSTQPGPPVSFPLSNPETALYTPLEALHEDGGFKLSVSLEKWLKGNHRSLNSLTLSRASREAFDPVCCREHDRQALGFGVGV
jgi:hypothetical protein